MGTSKPSSGPGSNVPLVPPWVPPLPPAEQPPDESSEDLADDEGQLDDLTERPLAPKGRFSPARRALGEFAAETSTDERRGALERGLGHYVRKGLGGAPTGTRRMAATAATAGSLLGVLQALGAGQTPDPQLNPATLAGLSGKQIADRIINTIQPTDGTQDTEASRNALAGAMSDVLDEFPTADLASLAPDEIDYAIERYLGRDLCNRILLDVGLAIEAKAPSSAVAIARIEEMREFVMSKVAACARAMKERGAQWSKATAAKFAAKVIRQTLDIFEDYHR